ncbi:LOW QUALITY PROTEIN: interferon-induced protein with tetratricopeptide repeats 5-like [Sceloporus undulatus]|uniref:LOW QUALITY PROTEIN: interferon-induced protein with tetratricopeptide repeats 5-like n=1 Tax=Sceloporus undulatus TaxID=8520 RepID=UPI001C4CD994|nr:LOW QUALITY PROTEIN: interferon-induced protein with tetratricopeptide repeats 5-like [Sceloporus undulatus]
MGGLLSFLYNWGTKAPAILSPKDALEKILQQLDCHFTWVLLKEDIDPDELEERILEQIELLHSKSKAQNYHLLAYVKYLNGKKEEALENLQKAEEAVKIEYPGDTEKQSLVTWGNYAWLYYHMDKLTEAQVYIDKIERLCKQHGSALPYKMKLPQIFCEKGWALLKFGGKYYEKAKESFAKALEEEPDNPEFNAGYSVTVYRLEDYYGRKSAAEGSSLEPLRRAVQLNPEDPFVMSLLAIKLQETNKIHEGEKYIEKALAKYPGIPYVLRYAAKFYRKKGDVQIALKYLTEALRLTPNSSFLHHQIGICYRTQYFGMKKKMVKNRILTNVKEMIRALGLCIFHFEKVVKHKPKFVYAYVDLANMYIEQAQLRRAEAMFQKVLAMSNLTCVEKQQLHFNYGRFQEFHKKSESEAMKHYLEGLKIEHKSFERNKCKRHLNKLIDKRIKKGLGDAQCLGSLGFIAQLYGQKQLAVQCYERALKWDPQNEEYLSALLKIRLSLQS